LGRALVDVKGDALLRDEVDFIDRADAAQRLRLAHAHATYYRGRFLFAQRRVAEAAPLIERSQRTFAAVGSPMAAVANYYSANVRVDEDRIDDALAMFNKLKHSVGDRYPALRAEIAWT